MTSIISKADRDAHLGAVIKSNLISFGLSVEQIDKITLDLKSDIIHILNQLYQQEEIENV